MTARLILVRHATPEIIPDVAPAEWPLTQDGRTAALSLAKKLAAYAPAFLATSPELKALATAEIIGAHIGAPLTIDAGLAEHKRAGAGHLPRDEFLAAMARFFKEPERLVFGEETATAAHARFSESVTKLQPSRQDKTPVIVAHGTVISLFVARAAGLDPFTLWRSLETPCAIVLVKAGFRIEAMIDARP